MPADGLTKLLPRQKHENFVKQLGLVDLSKLGLAFALAMDGLSVACGYSEVPGCA
jgi:hypothetical protein